MCRQRRRSSSSTKVHRAAGPLSNSGARTPPNASRSFCLSHGLREGNGPEAIECPTRKRFCSFSCRQENHRISNTQTDLSAAVFHPPRCAKQASERFNARVLLRSIPDDPERACLAADRRVFVFEPRPPGTGPKDRVSSRESPNRPRGIRTSWTSSSSARARSTLRTNRRHEDRSRATSCGGGSQSTPAG